MRESGFISLDKGALHYLRMGEGKRLLLAFHGYGNEAAIFTPFLQYLEKDFTIYSIDLPHHGRSKWEKHLPLEKKDLTDLVKQLLDKTGVREVSLLGYSMGGRVCLTLIEQMPKFIDKALLIAADGLIFNPLYYFVTKTFVGKRLFKGFLSNPVKYMKLIEKMREKKWLGESRYKFVMWYLQSEKDREFLLQVWPGLKKIVPNLKKLKNKVNEYNIPVHIFMGAYDRVIPVANAERFKKGLKSVHLHVMEKGHRTFDAETIPHMAKCLL